MNTIPAGADRPRGEPRVRVLCVDDNHYVADSGADLLNALGFHARACYSGRTALAEAETFLPRVCLIDLHMPGMDGDELAVRLRAQAGGVPPVLVAVTAMSDDRSRQRVRDAGFDLHLVKPVNPLTLSAVLDELRRVWDQVASSPQLVAGAIARFSDAR